MIDQRRKTMLFIDIILLTITVIIVSLRFNAEDANYMEGVFIGLSLGSVLLSITNLIWVDEK